MIKNKIVDGGPALKIPAHLSFGQHLLDCLRKICEAGDDVALINGDSGENTTYKEILLEVVNLTLGLRRLGVKRGDVIALSGENQPRFVIAAMGALCCGATIATVNPMYTKDELLHVLSISKPKLMFCSAASLKLHRESLKHISSIQNVIQLNGPAMDNDILEFNRISMKGDDVESLEPTAVQGSVDPAFILFSSGTTGLPKGVMLTHVNILYALSLFEASDKHDTVLSIVPWYHAYGLMTTINDILVKRSLIYFAAGFNPVKYLDTVQKYKIRSLLVVPPIVVFLAKSPLVAKYDLSSVEAVWCGAAPLSCDTIQAALKRLPNCKGVFQAYGMTETSLVATKDNDQLAVRKPGSGGYPIPGIKVKVVHIETRDKLGPNEEGEICIKGPTIMRGYVGNGTATREMFDEEGYMKTGDIGYYDADGCFFVVDRLKELIKYKAYQVAPAAVESVVLQHAGVAECGVVGRPHEAAGELPTAFVVLKPNITVTEQEILDFANSKLSSSSRLRGGVILVKEIPKNPSGKILRRVLKQKLQTMKKSKL